MHFNIMPDGYQGFSSDGAYVVSVRSEKYGLLLDISVQGALFLTVWVRQNWRSVLEHEKAMAGDASSVVEWVVDNGASEGADRLIALSDKVGDGTLGQVLHSFFLSYEAYRASQPGWPTALVRIGCRGNQRSHMESLYGP
ncbi:MAG: hypothetical protein JWR77_1611 [Rhizorhabdus sp.]|nr:hypothetical protein [Rhizorhabdus sp.]